MARINKNKLISGAIGNIVFRDVRKKQLYNRNVRTLNRQPIL
ncbi:hypothetical protein QWY90_00620 [Flavobacterium paronense]|nr:hypothetical protein [Flavobacterium paronense]MDN3675847.1 hypothetical protein [Flavobacterium paronense]